MGEAPIGTTFKLTSQPRRRQDKPGETWVSASTSASRYEHELSTLVTIASLMALEFAVPSLRCFYAVSMGAQYCRRNLGCAAHFISPKVRYIPCTLRHASSAFHYPLHYNDWISTFIQFGPHLDVVSCQPALDMIPFPRTWHLLGVTKHGASRDMGGARMAANGSGFPLSHGGLTFRERGEGGNQWQ